TRKLSHKTIVLGIQPGLYEVNEFYSALLLGPGLEQLLLPCPDRPACKLPLHDDEALLYLSLIYARAVPPEKELGHVSGHGILALELANKILPNKISFERFSSDLVQCVELHLSSPR